MAANTLGNATCQPGRKRRLGHRRMTVSGRHGIMTNEIYVCEGCERVGPFDALEDALRFLLLMESSGEDLDGIVISVSPLPRMVS